MKDNLTFLGEIVRREAYIGFSNVVLETLLKVAQDKKLISHVFAKGNSFAIKYFSSLSGGFINRDAAKMFVDQISLPQNRNVATNDAVRDKIYEMLVDSKLKAKYTIIRKKYGCHG